MKAHVKPGAFCIDATVGRGHDTAFLCRLAGKSGKVIGLDLQPEAIESARTLLDSEGLSATLTVDSHANIADYAAPLSVDCIAFNFGWLPGGDHNIFTEASVSVAAISKGLELLKPFGIMSLCVYYGRNNGYAERDAILEYLKTPDPGVYTVIVNTFWNRTGDHPIPVSIIKQG